MQQYQDFKARISRLEKSLSPFELTAAVAFDYFAREKVDIAVIEVGVGGLHDATNVFSRPLVCVITAIGLDHQGLLGDSILEIAEQKAGIMKPGVNVVIGPQRDPKVQSLLKMRAEELDCRISLVRPAKRLDGLYVAAECYDETTVEYTLNLNGDFQLENSAIAINAVRMAFPLMSAENISKGMSQITRWPARLDRVVLKGFGS